LVALVQLRVGLVDTPVAPSEGKGFEETPGVGQVVIVKLCSTAKTEPANTLSIA